MINSIAAALPPKQRIKGRRLVIVDIENIIGGAALDPHAVHAVRSQVESAIAVVPGDIVVIGTCHLGLPAVGFTWTSARYVLGSGPDGADLALLEVLRENIESRFSEAVIVSGDGIFAGRAAQLAAVGVTITVASRPEALSNRLRMAAHQVVYITELDRPAAIRPLGGAA